MWDGDSLWSQVLRGLSDSSKPTVWDGDLSERRKLINSSLGSEPTVWDGDFCKLGSMQSFHYVLSPPCGIPFPSLKFLKTKRKGFNILKAWKTGG